jgi:hypothetical protein
MPLKRALPRHAIARGVIVDHPFIMAPPAPPTLSTPLRGLLLRRPFVVLRFICVGNEATRETNRDAAASASR